MNSLIFKGAFVVFLVACGYALIIPQNIVDCIEACVMGYYYTFITCWYLTLYYLNSMVIAYINYLGLLTNALLAFPTCLIVSVTAVVCLYVTLHFLDLILTILSNIED
jgi:hypothetical protein